VRLCSNFFIKIRREREIKNRFLLETWQLRQRTIF
jgi:hypothetical protein